MIDHQLFLRCINIFSIPIDYSHYMAAVSKYYVSPFVSKNKKSERSFLFNCYKVLFWAKDAVERDLILFSMLILAYSHPEGVLFR